MYSIYYKLLNRWTWHIFQLPFPATILFFSSTQILFPTPHPGESGTGSEINIVLAWFLNKMASKPVMLSVGL